MVYSEQTENNSYSIQGLSIEALEALREKLVSGDKFTGTKKVHIERIVYAIDTQTPLKLKK